MAGYSVESARQSDQATFPFRVIYLDYRFIGAHEDLDTKPEANIYTSMLAHGYDGPPVSVFQRGKDTLFNTGPFGTNVDADYGIFGVADGHHRFKSIKLLGEKGLLKSVYVPFQLIPAHDPAVIRIGTLSGDNTPLTVEEIENSFVNPSAAVRECSSHFQTKIANGEWVKLQESQPDIKVDRADFIANH